MKKIVFFLTACLIGAVLANQIIAATQDKYELPEPYLGWEKAYLRQFRQVQAVMDEMIKTTVLQLKEPEQDILHNRVCAALAYRMALDSKLPEGEQRLAVVTDLLHNITKEDTAAVLTNQEVFQQSDRMVKRLREAGHLNASREFWGDEKVLKNPKIGGNRALIHHITSALTAGQMLSAVGGYSRGEIEKVEDGVIGHSTGYWYFRQSVDDVVGQKGAWRLVYPEPESNIAKFAHDADLISQFVPESVIPDGSKWRVLAAKRWAAKNPVEEGHIVFYVFYRLFEEAKTEPGRALAREQWHKIQPELIKLMKLKPDDDPIKVLGVPKIFQR